MDKRFQSALVFATTLGFIIPYASMNTTCILPRFPRNGYYTIPGKVNVHPGMAFENVQLEYGCRSGFIVEGPTSNGCHNGLWNYTELTQCLSQCVLNKNPSVKYFCPRKTSSFWEIDKECGELVTEGTIVLPKCRAPFYYSKEEFTNMLCEAGVWNYVATCIPECGVALQNNPLQIASKPANYGSTPWHVGIFYKLKDPYQQVCGGSIISSTIVISAAHCFWRKKTMQRPSSEFAVAAGKLYRHWDSPLDEFVQKSDVQEIRLPPRFSGLETNYGYDIAIVTVTNQFHFGIYVRPVCINFDYRVDSRQLMMGRIGKIASWGRSANDGIQEHWQFLQEVNLPYVDIEQCLIESSDMREYITSDKFCAYYNDTARELCQGDTGGGLVFPAQKNGEERYILRGVASTARGDKQNCVMFTTFTQVVKHEQFIKQYYTAPQNEKCILPPIPESGNYTTSDFKGQPGDAFDSVYINITCHKHYKVKGPSLVHCYNGWWLDKTPECTIDSNSFLLGSGPARPWCDLPSVCGPYSQCAQISLAKHICSCLPDHKGTPPKCTPPCMVDTDCDESKACKNQTCEDPCNSACVDKAVCFVKNHLPICA